MATAKTLRELGEWGLIARAQAHAGPAPAGAIGIGDDAALVPGAMHGLGTLAAVDLLVEGVHFRRDTTPGFDLGWKALAVNLSDVAAMGGRPTAALVGLALPGELDVGYLEAFYEGLATLARTHGVWLAGGDTTGSPGPVMISLTILGTPGPRVLTRGGAQAGDVVFQTGTPGRSAAGLACLERPDAAATLDQATREAAIAAHRRPSPQLAAGAALAGLPHRLVLLDDSDGLARSARLLAEAGEVDVWLEAEALAPDPVTAEVARAMDADPRAWALHGGEDYHLVGACGPDAWPEVEAALAAAGERAVAIGSVRAAADPARPGAWLQRGSGPPDALVGEVGYAHFARTSFPPR